MIIERKSMFTGITRQMDLDITQEQIDKYKSGVLIQDAFPNLTVDEREFIMTGATAYEWDAFVGVDEE